MFAGLLWFAIGIFLLTLGIKFILASLSFPEHAPKAGFSTLNFLKPLIADPQNGCVVLLAVSLLLGYMKGRFVLGKTVQKQVSRIMTLPNPAHIKYLYTKAHYLLIGLMIGLGISMRFLPITLDTRGFIDVAIGSALMNGSMLYFRFAVNYHLIKKQGNLK